MKTIHGFVVAAWMLMILAASCGEKGSDSPADSETDDASTEPDDTDTAPLVPLSIRHAVSPALPPDCVQDAAGDPQENFPLDFAQTEVVMIGVVVENGMVGADAEAIVVDNYVIRTEVVEEGPLLAEETIDATGFVSAGATDLFHVHLLSPAVIDHLRTTYGCERVTLLDINTIADAIIDGADFEAPDAGGGALPDRLRTFYRFGGHRQSGDLVESPEFSVDIDLYCGPSGGFTPCRTDPCDALCGEAEVPCTSGLVDQVDCEDYLSTGDRDVLVVDSDSAITYVDLCSEYCVTR